MGLGSTRARVAHKVRFFGRRTPGQRTPRSSSVARAPAAPTNAAAEGAKIALLMLNTFFAILVGLASVFAVLRLSFGVAI